MRCWAVYFVAAAAAVRLLIYHIGFDLGRSLLGENIFFSCLAPFADRGPVKIR